MKIGIYKPGKKVYFNENTEDHSAISIEVTRIIKILAYHGHQVFILSDNDYIPNSILNVSNVIPEALDKVFIFNGINLTLEIIQQMQELSPYVNLIVTDLSLIPPHNLLLMFDNIFTQSTTYGTYGAIEQHECYEFERINYPKSIGIYFGGTERGRTADFMEYVNKPNVTWFGKSHTLNIKNYIPYHEHLEYMKKAKYSIVIGDDAYNKVGFVTPRYYECIRYEVIAFVDYKYDPNEILIKQYDFRRVRSYDEMMSKIKILEKEPILYNHILKQQWSEITKKMIYGQHIIHKLLR